MEFILYRDVFDAAFTLGRLSVDGRPLGFTCEDTDRKLEDGGEKIPGKTAIPRGRYPLQLSMSQRFKRVLPEITNVPGFTGIRIHGGNTHADTEGCPLLGTTRTKTGVMNCNVVNATLISLLHAAKERGEDCWIEIR